MAPDESPFLVPLEEVEQARPGANWKAVGPEAKKRLAPLVKHYMGKPHPFTACVRDQIKHGLSEDHANRRCAVVKDIGMGGTGWHGKRSKNVKESVELLVEEAEARLEVLEEALTWNGIRLLVMERIRILPGGRMTYESEEAAAIADGVVEDLILIEETADQHRHKDGKWQNLTRRVTGRKRSLADAYAEVKKAGHAGSGKVSEEFTEGLHPRDRTGRWRRKIAALKPGTKTEIEGVRVSRSASGDFTVHHPPTSPRGKNPDVSNADANLASPEIASASLAKAVVGRETNPRLPGAPHPEDVADRAARARKEAKLPSPAQRRKNEQAARERSPFFDSPSTPMKDWTDEELRRAAEGSPGSSERSRALTREMRRRNKRREEEALERLRKKRGGGRPSEPASGGLQAAKELRAALPRTATGFPKPPKASNGVRPRGSSGRVGSRTHYFLTPDGKVTAHVAPSARAAMSIGVSQHGPGTVYLGFATYHRETGEYSLNGHPEVIRKTRHGGGGRPKPGSRARRPETIGDRDEVLRNLLGRRVAASEWLPFWLAPLAEGKLPQLRSNKARPGDKDYGQSSNPSAFDEKKHPRGGKGKKEGGKFVRKGSSGTDVAHVQKAVGAQTSEGGGQTTDAPGAFGFSTFAAVKAFQEKHGLKVDGVVGRQTVAAIAGDKNAKNVAPGALTAGDRKRLRGKASGRRKKAKRKPEERHGGGVLIR